MTVDPDARTAAETKHLVERQAYVAPQLTRIRARGTLSTTAPASDAVSS